MRKSIGEYPDNWIEIACQVKEDANWTCVRCAHPHNPQNVRTLTVHHLDMNPGNSAWWNLLPLCQACHLSIQGRVYLDRPWVMADHSDWFKVYAGGYFAWKYLSLDVTREEVERDLEWYVNIERRHFGIVPETRINTGVLVLGAPA